MNIIIPKYYNYFLNKIDRMVNWLLKINGFI